MNVPGEQSQPLHSLAAAVQQLKGLASCILCRLLPPCASGVSTPTPTAISPTLRSCEQLLCPREQLRQRLSLLRQNTSGMRKTLQSKHTAGARAWDWGGFVSACSAQGVASYKVGTPYVHSRNTIGSFSDCEQ